MHSSRDESFKPPLRKTLLVMCTVQRMELDKQNKETNHLGLSVSQSPDPQSTLLHVISPRTLKDKAIHVAVAQREHN